MCIRRKYLENDRKYFHIETLVSVFPNMTCKYFENRRTDKVFIAKMNFEKGVCIGKRHNH